MSSVSEVQVKVRESLTGRRFNRLVVTGRADDYVKPNGSRQARWACLCDCGGTASVIAAKLKSGSTRSCGCLATEVTSARSLIDLTGMRFGRWTVLRRAEDWNYRPGQRFPQYLARCDCATERVVLGNSLRSGGSKSCGCLRSDVTAARNAKDVVGYDGAHDRVRAARGLPTRYACASCDEQASEWAYDHADPNAMIGPIKNGSDRMAPYSLDVAHYQPMCVPCHRGLDGGLAAARRAT